MKSLYVLVVDNAWAKLYKTGPPPAQLALVYHQALFGRRTDGNAADEELARSLCRLLRADRLTGKYERLIFVASGDMLGALRRQYDGEPQDLLTGRIEDLPARYGDEDIAAYVNDLLAQAQSAPDARAVTVSSK